MALSIRLEKTWWIASGDPALSTKAWRLYAV
jgi:hypothetical protein